MQAVAAYNNPMATFKSGTYVVLMHIAWTTLLLAVFYRKGVKPYYRKETPKGKPRYRKPDSAPFQRIDGRPRVWELRECIRQYWADKDDAVSQNLRFFVGLRNFIEHTEQPGLDLGIFGECQALLFNLEEFMQREFGNRYALRDSLAISLQFSRMRDPRAQEALRRLLRPVPREITNYIQRFRSSLSTEILGDMAFSYKVFLVPMLGNHRSEDALAVQFVPYDPSNPAEYDRLVGLIKQKFIPVLHAGMLTPTKVAEQVAKAIKPLPFGVSHHHVRAWRYWSVRPKREAPEPSATHPKYCVYDNVHKDYLYTEEWVQFLIEEFQKPGLYEAVMGKTPSSAPATA